MKTGRMYKKDKKKRKAEIILKFMKMYLIQVNIH